MARGSMKDAAKCATSCELQDTRTLTHRTHIAVLWGLYPEDHARLRVGLTKKPRLCPSFQLLAAARKGRARKHGGVFRTGLGRPESVRRSPATPRASQPIDGLRPRSCGSGVDAKRPGTPVRLFSFRNERLDWEAGSQRRPVRPPFRPSRPRPAVGANYILVFDLRSSVITR